jgi:transposase
MRRLPNSKKNKAMNEMKGKRIVGLDMHPDVFSAAARAGRAGAAQLAWVDDREETAGLERWAQGRLRKEDIVVLEASGNTFEVAARLHGLGFTALVLESAQAGKIRDNFCNDDKHSAVKLARVYLSGLAKIVWQPDAKTREYREVFFAHRNAVKDATRCRNRLRTYLTEHCVRLRPGTALTEASGEATVLRAKAWTALQCDLLGQKFAQLREVEARRRQLERMMARELAAQPRWARLWRLMGIRHRVAFGLMAMIGDINRFPSAKKLVGYLGLAPRKDQSGNNAKGTDLGIGRFGRKDLRALLLQSAHNALVQRGSPLHKWGWKLLVKKHRNEAAAAIARKLTVSVWYLLKGHFTPLVEPSEHLRAKLLKLATVLGKDLLKSMGFPSRDAFVDSQIKQIQLIT